MAHFLLRAGLPASKTSHRGGRTTARYSRFLHRLQPARWTAIVVIAAVSLLGLLAGMQLTDNRTVVATPQDRTLLVQWDSLPGTSTTEVSRLAARAADELRTVPGVSGVGGHIGRAISSDQVVVNSSAELWVSMDKDADFARTESAVRDVVKGYPGISSNVLNYSQQKIGAVSDFTEPGFAVRVFGPELPVLEGKAEEVRKAIADIKGVSNARVDAGARMPIIEVEVNLAEAQKAGIKPGDARRAAAALMQGIVVGNLFEQQKVFEVVVRGAANVRDDLSSVRDLLLDGPNGTHVPLGQVAEVRIVPNETVILHDDTSRRIDVVADLGGRPLADVENDIHAALQRIQFPLEYHAEIPTKYGEQQRAGLLMAGLGGAALLAVLLLLQTAVRSWRLAVAVFLGLPAALAGGLAAAAAGGERVTLISLAALAALLGITARNTAVFAARCDQRLQEGPGAGRAAMVLAVARERLRPVLAAAAVTAVFLVPPALSGGTTGADLLGPTAAIIAAGLVSTTLFALFALPMLVLWFGPRGAPEDWAAIKHADVELMQEKVGAR